MLELAVLENTPAQAMKHLTKAAAVIRENWEPGTTANNLNMIEHAREARGEDTSWLKAVISDLEKRAAS